MGLPSYPNLNMDSPAVGMSSVFLCFALRLSQMLNKIRVGGLPAFSF